jgi:hypothetical protein
MSAYLLDRVRSRRMPDAVAQLLSARWYEERLSKLAADLGRDPGEVRAEAAGYVREMAASRDERAVEAFRGFSRWFMRAYDVLVDEDQIAQLRKLDRKATLAFAFSHRSYLDGMLLPEAIIANRLTPALTYGGANMNFFPFGAWAKRTGAIFIRRQTRDIPVYRCSRCAPTPRNLCKTTRTCPGRLKAAGPGPASCDLRCTASCVTSRMLSTKSTVPKCIWCRRRSCTTSCTR